MPFRVRVRFEREEQVCGFTVDGDSILACDVRITAADLNRQRDLGGSLWGLFEDERGSKGAKLADTSFVTPGASGEVNLWMAPVGEGTGALLAAKKLGGGSGSGGSAALGDELHARADASGGSGSEGSLLRSGSSPPSKVWFVEFIISDQTPVRVVVKGFAMSHKVGGIVQRDTADATKVMVRAATADKAAMKAFLDEINGFFPPGSVSQSVVVESTQQSHISMSYKQFCSVATSNTIISTAKQALSANEGDDLSVSGRASSRGI